MGVVVSVALQVGMRVFGKGEHTREQILQLQSVAMGSFSRLTL